jgi:hypothetical protein
MTTQPSTNPAGDGCGSSLVFITGQSTSSAKSSASLSVNSGPGAGKAVPAAGSCIDWTAFFWNVTLTAGVAGKAGL